MPAIATKCEQTSFFGKKHEMNFLLLIITIIVIFWVMIIGSIIFEIAQH